LFRQKPDLAEPHGEKFLSFLIFIYSIEDKEELPQHAALSRTSFLYISLPPFNIGFYQLVRYYNKYKYLSSTRNVSVAQAAAGMIK